MELITTMIYYLCDLGPNLMNMNYSAEIPTTHINGTIYPRTLELSKECVKYRLLNIMIIEYCRYLVF